MIQEAWPDFTCVLCFFIKGFERLGYALTPNELAKYLDIKIPTNENNPFLLEQTSDESSLGIKPHLASKQVNDFILSQLPDSNLKFFHIPLNTILYRMYFEFLQELQKYNIVIGFGYNYSDFKSDGGEGVKNKHVSFLSEFNQDSVVIEDFYINNNGVVWDTSFEKFIKSIESVNDGFWLIGKNTDMRSILWN